VIREYNDVQRMKEESGGKKVSSFERFIYDKGVFTGRAEGAMPLPK